jgi:hypothetical protein
VLGAVLLALTLGGHAAGSGALPDLLGLLLAGGLAFLLARAVSARALPLPRLLAFLLGGQALLHVILTVSHAHGSTAHAPDAAAMVMGHVAAAAVAALVLSRGDALVDRWAAYLASAIRAWRLTPAAVTAGSAPGPQPLAADTPRLESLRHHVERRGPPRPAILARV